MHYLQFVQIDHWGWDLDPPVIEEVPYEPPEPADFDPADFDPDAFFVSQAGIY